MDKRIYVTGGLMLMATVSYGQYAADAFRYSEQIINGTARFQGIGGNHAALGADASNAWGNPAGLGFYNRSELSISPSLRLLNVGANYLGQTTNSSKAVPFVGSASLIFAGGSPNNENRSVRRTTFGLTYSRQISLNNEYVYQGRNNRSSLADSYLETVNARGIPSGALDGEYDGQNNIADNIEAAAYQLYLINPTQNNGTSYFRYDVNVPVDQRGSFTSNGSVSQWGLSLASNFNDKLYVGGTLGFTRTRYEFTDTFDESYVGGRVFNGFRQTSDYSVTGNGINLNIGLIYKLDQNVQIGANVVSPNFTTRTFREEFSQNLSIDPIGIPQTDEQGRPVLFIPDITSVPTAPQNFDFTITTPLRASAGVTYLFGRSGFITATAEYVGYKGLRAGTSFYTSAADNQAFRNDIRNEIEQTYNNTVNFRVGGEFRSGLLRLRAGAAYIPSAYNTNFDQLARDNERNTLLYSAGIGARNDRFFADLAGVFYTTKSAYTPYTLNNPQNYGSALLTNRNANLTLSLGVFF
ncbi:hypothetical protein DYU11_11880 [Fibrisoma montanum]|uniref:Aromatic hydrocarbon degradation protein n=1 Tax=Fibrisoma montanum TaxID=2305895 RepID=A0A418MBE0_9BACT|nr:outer membrane protein transport protein [Fibrisoma montanum]RIV23674.1 hypothetical protein DYU11_11880 [Fibrisoma montanum]